MSPNFPRAPRFGAALTQAALEFFFSLGGGREGLGYPLILWMADFLPHFQPMGNHVWLAFAVGIVSFQGCWGGAKWISSIHSMGAGLGGGWGVGVLGGWWVAPPNHRDPMRWDSVATCSP